MEGESMKLSWLFTLLCVLVLLALLPSTSSAEDVASLHIEPPEVTVRPGEHFTVALMVYDVEDMMGFIAELHYFPSVITAEDVQFGSFVEDNFTGQFTPIGPEIDNEAGMILLGFMAGTPHPSGSGELAVITLVAQGEGQSLLAFENTMIFGTSDYVPVYTHNGRITVELYHAYLPLVLR
jgi:hypothetical protein